MKFPIKMVPFLGTCQFSPGYLKSNLLFHIHNCVAPSQLRRFTNIWVNIAVPPMWNFHETRGNPYSPTVSPVAPWQWDVQSYQSLHLQNCIIKTPRNGTVKRLWKTLNLPIFSRIPRSWYVFILLSSIVPKSRRWWVLPHGDQVSHIDTMSYGSSQFWSVSILGVIPKWKSTARLPKYMINLQIENHFQNSNYFQPRKTKTQLVQNQSQFQDHLVIQFNHFWFLPGQIPPSSKLVKHLLCFRKALRNRMAARIVVTGRTVPARSGERLAPESRETWGKLSILLLLIVY